MSTYTFASIDPRPASRAAMLTLLASTPTLGIEVTERELARACSAGNIDPQHGHGCCPPSYVDGHRHEDVVDGYSADSASHPRYRAAIDAAWYLFVDRGVTAPCTLATIRPDLDSIGAMAVIVLASLGLLRGSFERLLPSAASRVVAERMCAIARADSYRPGPWAPRPLPTSSRLYSADESAEPADGRRSLAHLGAICSPRPGQVTLPIEERVAIMCCWLMWGDDVDDPSHAETYLRIDAACGLSSSMPGVLSDGRTVGQAIEDARHTVEASRIALAEELARPGAIRVECRYCGSPMEQDLRASRACAAGCIPGLAQVRVSHAGALGAGYCLAPLVVAFDRLTPGKVTISAAEDGHADFAALRVALNAAEVMALCDCGWKSVGGQDYHESDCASSAAQPPQWGGPRNLLGSPQGSGTRLSEAAIVGLVREALLSP